MRPRELACVRHVASGVELVAVPGGTYLAGLRPEEQELMRAREYDEDTAIEWLEQIAATSAPREVTIQPFLLARAPVSATLARANGVEVGG